MNFSIASKYKLSNKLSCQKGIIFSDMSLSNL